MNLQNPFKGTHVEFHILQSFPVTCLNRDDVGAPKTAVVGGTTRARVSSQCWKRHVRLKMKELGAICGERTKAVNELVKEACLREGATEEQAAECSEKIAHFFVGNKKNKVKAKKKTKDKEEVNDTDESREEEDNETLLFLSSEEAKIIARSLKDASFKLEDSAIKTDKDLGNRLALGKERKYMDATDIALFGRMVAKAQVMNVEAAASFSHAISTHKVSNEIEFFTALDDRSSQVGAAHMGSLEFNSATYYRYISVDLGQLCETLGKGQIANAADAFIKALFLATPSARQTTQSGASPWEFAKVLIRKGQRLQVPFEAAVKMKEKDGGFLQASKDALVEYLAKKEKLTGSLFGKEKEFTFGDDENFSIDDLVGDIKKYIAERNK